MHQQIHVLLVKKILNMCVIIIQKFINIVLIKEKLIIELDGEVHNNPLAAEKDNTRTNYLKELGFTVVRFENKMVFENLSSVFMEIKDNFKPVVHFDLKKKSCSSY